MKKLLLTNVLICFLCQFSLNLFSQTDEDIIDLTAKQTVNSKDFDGVYIDIGNNKYIEIPYTEPISATFAPGGGNVMTTQIFVIENYVPVSATTINKVILKGTYDFETVSVYPLGRLNYPFNLLFGGYYHTSGIFYCCAYTYEKGPVVYTKLYTKNKTISATEVEVYITDALTKGQNYIILINSKFYIFRFL